MLVAAGVGMEITHVRFRLREAGVTDLGDVPLEFTAIPEGGLTTVGECQPASSATGLNWPVAYARLRGRIQGVDSSKIRTGPFALSVQCGRKSVTIDSRGNYDVPITVPVTAEQLIEPDGTIRCGLQSLLNYQDTAIVVRLGRSARKVPVTQFDFMARVAN